MRIAPLLVLVAGCLTPDLVPCGDLACAAGDVCVGDRCVEPEQLEACVDLDEGGSCTALDGRAGRCLGGVCEQASCGDGYVDPDIREVCDGSTTAQCVDFGYDLGRPACTDCDIDTTPCVRFGWKRIEYSSSQDAWTDGTILAYTRYAPSGLVVKGGGFSVDVPDFHHELHGGGGRVFALSGSNLVEARGSAMVPIPAPTSDSIGSVDVASDGTPYVLSGCSVFRLVGTTWEQVADGTSVSSQYTCQFVRVHGAGPAIRIVVTTFGSHMYSVKAGALAPLVDVPGALVMTVVRANTVLFATSSGLFEYDPAGMSLSLLITGGTTSIAPVGSSIYASMIDGTLNRYNGVRVDRMRGPTGGKVMTDGKGGLYMYGGPIYRFSGMSFGELESPPISINDRIVASMRTGTNVLVASEQFIYVAKPDGGWETHGNPVAPSAMSSISGRSKTQIAVASASQDDHSFVARSATGIDDFWIVEDSETVKDAVWMASDGTLVAVGIDAEFPNLATGHAWFGVLPPTGMFNADWNVVTGTEPGCRVSAVHGSDLAHVIAAGRCGQRGVVWERQANGSWTELYRSPTDNGGFRGVHRTSDGMMFAVGDSGSVWTAGTTWHVEPTVVGRTLSGTSTDMWVSGAFTNVQRFDGTAWTQVATSALSEIAVAVGTDDIIFPGGSPGHVNLIRDPDVVP